VVRESLVIHEHSFDFQVDRRDPCFGSKRDCSMEVMLNTIANIHIFLEKTNWQNGDWSWVGISPWSSKKLMTLSMFLSTDNFSKNK